MDKMMNKYKYVWIGGVMVMSLLMVMCMEITQVNQPSEATIEEQIDISVSVDIAPEEDASHKLVFGVLAPKAWNISENAGASFTSPEADGNMRLATEDDIATDTTATWSETMHAKVGIGENYGQVEWVVFISENPVEVTNEEDFSGTINLSLQVGDQNMITQMGYVAANTGYGLNNEDDDYDTHFTECMEVSGGDNPVINLCGPAPSNAVSYTPEAFAWNDITTIHFDATAGADSEPTELAGAGEVYICATADYTGGTSEVCEANETTAMTSQEENMWEITIWPRRFFDIPPEAEINGISFHFRNQDGSTVVKNPSSGEDFQMITTCGDE